MRQNQFDIMTKTPVSKLIIKLSIPTILTMLVTNFYNLVENDELRETSFIGSVVINPSVSGAIGKSLINPIYCMDRFGGSEVFLRLSNYRVNILGVPFNVRAFPFRMQDKELMSCAEVTLLNIMDYFANNYHSYERKLPSDIINA